MNRPGIPRVVVVGHSHIMALQRAWDEAGEALGLALQFISLRQPGDAPGPTAPSAKELEQRRHAAARDFALAAREADAAVLCIDGNEHNLISFGRHQPPRGHSLESFLHEVVSRRLALWIGSLQPGFPRRVFLLPPPPPLEEAHVLAVGGKFIAELGQRPMLPRERRVALWQTQCAAVRAVAQQHRLDVLEVPADLASADGTLLPQYAGRDPAHGNAAYGRRIVEALGQRLVGVPATAAEPREPRQHPYRELPPQAFWNTAVAAVEASTVDPAGDPPFRLDADTRVATAGSCFAQHVSRRLREAQLNFLCTEPTSAAESAQWDATDFSARFGNVYTSRQLLQLFERAFGQFEPQEPVWPRHGGGWCDPFRPLIRRDGFDSPEAVLADRARHLDAVRRMFTELDVLVFTLGLTECWLARADGAAFPLAPGVAGGAFDAERHEFANLDVADVVQDMQRFLRKLRRVNPGARLILTVSPVPLMATAVPRHVLVSNTYSKSVLRVAAERIASQNDGVYYFPSYEIITGGHAAGRYFAADRRSVTTEGVDHVMRVFLHRCAGRELPDAEPLVDNPRLVAIAEAACDEEMLAR